MILKSIHRTFRYHLGSLAFGSLIIAIVQTIRVIILYLQENLKGKNNKVAQYILACLQFCCGCLEAALKFLNSNAYIEIAVYGYSFCEGAKAALQLIMSNALRFTVINGVSSFLLFLGKILVSFITSIIGLYLLTTPNANLGITEGVANYYIVPLILIFVISYIIASYFMSLYDSTIKTILLCFCEDSQRNDGSAAKPYFMSDNLKQFLNESSKQAAKV